jgi:hypothetical protein
VSISADSVLHQTAKLVSRNLYVCVLLTHTQFVQNKIEYKTMLMSCGPYKHLLNVLWTASVIHNNIGSEAVADLALQKPLEIALSPK